MKIARVGIVGAGQMGAGIAQVCAAAGYVVVLNDISTDRINHGLAAIAKNFDRRIGSGKATTEQKRETLDNITSSIDFADFHSCDLVIEAASEKESVKKQIFESLVPHLKADCILGSNTSSLSITRLASYFGRPEQFMGIHFMNPVPTMELVELIRGMGTADVVFSAVNEFVHVLGKTTIISQDFPGFILNRILLPMINEAIYALHEGVGGVEAIDQAMKLGARQPMGPLELADFIGLDTCLAIMQVLHDGFADSKYRPCPLLVKYVEAGWLGRKNKRGFYDYSGEKPVPSR